LIYDVTLRWVVTALFVLSAAACVRAMVVDRQLVSNVVSHTVHIIMAIAMVVMAWPRGADLPARAPMIFFLAVSLWFAVETVRSGSHRVVRAYNMMLMLATSWMYAAMGGLNLVTSSASDSMAAMPGMTMSQTPDVSESMNWVGPLNWVCTIGFVVAAMFWLYRVIAARIEAVADTAHQTAGLLCQLAMAAGMAIMFGVML